MLPPPTPTTKSATTQHQSQPRPPAHTHHHQLPPSRPRATPAAPSSPVSTFPAIAQVSILLLFYFFIFVQIIFSCFVQIRGREVERGIDTRGFSTSSETCFCGK
ncbi:ent-kaur-16-ene synthase, chloroplastic isoform X1 [Iris pallida]|uniref:Ent-kaur-16-ene synthase, chloroplastic isoform X1 n=1 Tax=Iris pallida TaxID=29817 RepID=A0AAX6I2Y4_IRIPA|nr:ent-kaur-16-ene synthase, chloroplastic isoform X1 [Iris pallida]